ncbi:hypothetical protein GGF32_006147 [Allomyces javanicus]|nr:hypothetical protein GGF32_006147 [Allomyces javanicus]
MKLLQVLLVVAFMIGSAQVCSANWIDNIAVASLWMSSSTDGRANAGQCLDFAPETANGEGAVAGLWGCHAPTDGYANNQRFGVWMSDSPSFYDQGQTWYDMSISHVHNGVRYCLDVDHGLARNGARIQFWKCHGQAPQLFSYNPYTNMIQYAADRRFCLSATSYWHNGANLELRDCKSSEYAEKYKLAPLGEPRDPGHRSLTPERFPVPQWRVSPDMPLELRQAFNATAGRVA